MNHPSALFAGLLFVVCAVAEAQSPGMKLTAPSALPGTIAYTPAPGSAQERRQFAEAVHLYRSGRWSAAYGRFIALADLGHPNAARIALSMHRDSQSRYGTLWDATPQQLQDWERSARRADPAPLMVAY